MGHTKDKSVPGYPCALGSDCPEDRLSNAKTPWNTVLSLNRTGRSVSPGRTYLYETQRLILADP